VCPEGFVYNIEVQDNNNYFVDGILVHNCHYAGGNDYSRLTSLIPAPIRILVSGTSLDSEKMTNKLVIIGTAGGYLYQIKNKDLIKKKVSLKPIIHFIYNKCAQDGRTYDENVEDYIHKSENRLEEFKKWIISEGHINKQIVVAFAIIKHGEFMYESFKNDSRFQNLNIDWVHGTDSDRTEKIKDFKESRTNLLIASTIIQEGLNIPNIEILNYGLGGSSKIQLKQFIGRAIRDDGKSSEVLIVDFYDDCKWLDVHSRERLKIYNAEEFDIVYHYKADKLGRMSKKII
jgi:superfamily II DNA or RNA helicase